MIYDLIQFQERVNYYNTIYVLNCYMTLFKYE